jgi:hypothetical protein
MGKLNSIEDLKKLRMLLEEKTFAPDSPRIRMCY